MPGDITVNILDNQLGLVQATGDKVLAHLGICAAGVPNQVYSLGSIPLASTTLGPGTLTENVADTIGKAAACLAVPVTPSVAGSVGSTTHTGTGAGTVVGSAMPVYQILAKITTGGVLGTMAVAFSVNGGAYSNPVVSTASSFSYLVPGTLTTLTFSAQTYTLNDVWTITTSGVITVAGSGTAGWVTQVSSTLDVYDVLVVIDTAGALGVAAFRYSLDGGNDYSPQIQVPAGGTYVIPNVGLMLTFASTFVALDTYSFTTVTAGFGTSDVAAALTALGNSPLSFFCAHVAGMGSSVAAAASMTSTVKTSLDAMETAFRYVMGIVECTQNDTLTNIIAGFANTVAPRVMVTVGDVLHQSSLNRGREVRRNVGIAIATRLAKTQPSRDPGAVKDGPLDNVDQIYWNELATPGLGSNGGRFTTTTLRPTKSGFYCEAGQMMAAPGSDFGPVGNRRVMDVACTIAVGTFVNELNADLLVNPGTGTIYDPEASRIEGAVKGALGTRLLGPTPPDAVAVDAEIDRTNNVQSTENINLTVKIVRKPRARTLTMTIGFSI